MDEAGIGARTARARKLKGWTQLRLAAEAGLSDSLIAKVETGRVPASPAFVAAAARALQVEPELLTGVADYSRELGELPGVVEMRRIVAEWDYVEPVRGSTLAQLELESAKLQDYHIRDKTPEVFEILPGHIRRLYGALTEAGADVRRMHSLLCNAYMLTNFSAGRTGLTSLQSSVLGRVSALAEEADDPIYRTLTHVQRGKVLMYYDAIQSGLDAVQRGIDAVAGDDGSATAMRGYGHLSGAIIAARGQRYGTAIDYLDEARSVVARGDESSFPRLPQLNATNVEFYACAIELEAGDPEKAATNGWTLKIPAGTSPTRTGHHYQDVARAWLLAGEPSKSLKALKLARKVAPQQTRRHPSVRETLVGIAAAERWNSESVSAFAQWVGVAV
ncbi:helix-turn-helix domain-containing protein [Nocardia abscessus]|uniref:helix-turn-helix domain-containing protein n=1 Tax=Nocardia abscessus TaxID=120957 RepID=UPI0003122202|nr:helix-turn-helix domain-containing protein [Nocardia abscessus]MCC3330732.1 helix-turn-helix domain-containing protein [Nocardia abscessus]